MKKGWQTKTLGEVCSFLNRGVSPKYVEKGGVAVLNQRCIRDHRVSFEVSRRHDFKAKNVGAERFVRAGDVLVNSTGTGTLGRVAQLREDPREPTTVDSHVTIVRPLPGQFHPEFFGYMLRDIEDELKESGEGCGGQTELNRSVLSDKFVVRFPQSLAEQQRIVGLLDEAFAGIAIAKANAEKKLQNARALLGSHLQSVFTKRGAGWVKKSVKEIAAPAKGSIRTGPFGSQLLHSEFVDEGIAVLGIDNAVANEFRWGKSRFITPGKYSQLQRYTVYPGDVLITIMGTCGRCAIVPDDIPTAINTKHICCITLDRSQCLPGYLHIYFLHAPQAQEFLAEHAKGAIMAGLNMGLIQELPVMLPPIKFQAAIVEAADDLREETQRLANIYERKLAALEALKKTLLHQAFSGNLTAGAVKSVSLPVPVSATVSSFVPILAVLPDITFLDLQAGIVAKGYQRHEAAGNPFYGRTKAEKGCQGVEAWVGIELQRQPMKNAAGPADSHRLREVTNYAREKGYFSFDKPDDATRHRFTKGPAFDALIAKTDLALGERKAEVDQMLDIMASMTLDEASLVTTVHSAWNNLLMDGETITEERIVTESRENWHPQKMDIDRKCFFKAIAWVREKKLAPMGKGKKVMNKPPQ